MTVSAAHPDELTAALRLAFRHHDPESRVARVAVGLDLIDRGELDPAGVLVARSGGRLLGAMVAAPVPGAAAAVWPPQVEPGVPAAVADELAARAVTWLRGQQVKLAQVLLGPEDVALAGPLLRVGFRHTTTLVYLRHFLDLPTDMLTGPEQLAYTPYADLDPATFAAVLGRTYEGTQDCPEISGARSPAEALTGHQAGGFDPSSWWLATSPAPLTPLGREAGGEGYGPSAGVRTPHTDPLPEGEREERQPAGVLLLNPSPDSDGWEVAYVGVVPEHRRRGFGRELMVKALLEAKAADQECLALAVDVRNRPARELYRGLGFEEQETREVLLAVWPK